jgi:photosystem II stability/assembly factor-like uncharacterized protein
MSRRNWKKSTVLLLMFVTGAWPLLSKGAETELPALTTKPVLQFHAAEQSAAAKHTKLLAAARAGKRIVAVGDYGTVLLSDDEGKTYRQARAVPVDSTLTSITFADERSGWAVGHWGVIIHTKDGGETWTVQRTNTSVDQPLFSVYFQNKKKGWAVGLWSLLLHTDDEGTSWSVVNVPPPPGAKKADRNFYAVFADTRGTLFVACEQGLVMRSTDDGASWSYTETGYKGSFWAGQGLKNGSVLVGGLRGTIFRTDDEGATWQQVPTSYKSSITGFAQSASGDIVASALDGVVLKSDADGRAFSGQQLPDRVPLTAVVDSTSGHPLLFSTSGVVQEAK